MHTLCNFICLDLHDGTIYCARCAVIFFLRSYRFLSFCTVYELNTVKRHVLLRRLTTICDHPCLQQLHVEKCYFDFLYYVSQVSQVTHQNATGTM